MCSVYSDICLTCIPIINQIASALCCKVDALSMCMHLHDIPQPIRWSHSIDRVNCNVFHTGGHSGHPNWGPKWRKSERWLGQPQRLIDRSHTIVWFMCVYVVDRNRTIVSTKTRWQNMMQRHRTKNEIHIISFRLKSCISGLLLGLRYKYTHLHLGE